MTCRNNKIDLHLLIVGICIFLYGLYHWHIHDKAKIVAYSKETNIDAEGILRTQGLSVYFEKNAVLKLKQSQIKKYKKMTYDQLKKSSEKVSNYMTAIVLITVTAIFIFTAFTKYMNIEYSFILSNFGNLCIMIFTLFLYIQLVYHKSFIDLLLMQMENEKK